MARTDLDMVL